jgi:putative SOS response-associated peptidase YedK
MCGRLNVIDDPGVQGLLDFLNIELFPEHLQESRFIRATQPVSIVREINGQRELNKADWWLLQERTEDGFKPSKYTSFNTRYDKLNVPRSAGYKPFRETRCIVPASGFGETEFVNKKPLHYFDMTAEPGEALAFAGLYKEWRHPLTGEWKLSCSVITLPPHPKLTHIHSKAMPLILPQNDGWLDAWLSPQTDIREFEPLLQPHLPQNLIAQQIDKPSNYKPVGEPIMIDHDRAV